MKLFNEIYQTKILINKKQLLDTGQYGSGMGSSFKSITIYQLFKTSIKILKMKLVPCITL